MDPGPASPGLSDGPPRARSRGISFRSDHSTGSGSKAVDSPREKAQKGLWQGSTKANPMVAMNEAQPGVMAATEQSTMQSLRESQHKDTYGNIIADPDRSNPTRPRLERPLDTIRSFEKAIDEGYKRRNSYMKQDSETWDKDNQFASRRSSFFGGAGAGGYDNSQGAHRPGPGSAAGGYYGSQSYNGHPRARYGASRMQSDSQIYAGQRPYPQHGYHQSHDTVNTGFTNGSDSTGPWANSTDPSSENSSIDKGHPMNKPSTPMDGYNQYGANGYHDAIMEEQGGPGPQDQYHHDYKNGPSPSHNGGGYYGQQQQQQHQNGYGRPMGGPAPPVQPPTQARRPIQLGGTPSGNGDNGYGRPPANLPPMPRQAPEPEKKGWLKRRFSKKV